MSADPVNIDNDIQIRVITQEDQPQVLELLRKYFFTDEPLTGHTEPIGQVQKEEEDFIWANVEHGTCFIAIHVPSNKAVGICMAGPQSVDEADHLFKEAAKEGNTKWGKILKFLACIERDAKVCEHYNVQKIMYIIATCVDSSMRGKSIGSRLYNTVRDLAKERGYQLLRADCTSFYSARIKDQLGWDCINTVYYKDYVDEDNKPVFTPRPPHDCCKSYALRL